MKKEIDDRVNLGYPEYIAKRIVKQMIRKNRRIIAKKRQEVYREDPQSY